MQIARDTRRGSAQRQLTVLALATCLAAALCSVVAAAPKRSAPTKKPLKTAPVQQDDDINDKGYSKAALQALNVAKFHYKRGEFDQAALLLHSAFRIQPKAEFLFNAARAEHRAMKLNMAKRHFEHCLKLPDATEAVRRRAKMHIKEIETVQVALDSARREAVANAAPLPGEVSATVIKDPGPPPSPAWQRPAGWAGVGLGAVLLGAGAYVWSSYAADQQALNDKTDNKDAAGQVVGIDWQRYEDSQQVLNSRAALRTGLVAAGAVVAATGTWLLLTARDGTKETSWQLTPALGPGVVASLRF